MYIGVEIPCSKSKSVWFQDFAVIKATYIFLAMWLSRNRTQKECYQDMILVVANTRFKYKYIVENI